MFEWLPACLPSRPRHYPTMIRIMQLGRSYSRRLKSVNHEIYELWSSARHAYNTIRPAVKTSRPQKLNLWCTNDDVRCPHSKFNSVLFNDRYYGVSLITFGSGFRLYLLSKTFRLASRATFVTEYILFLGNAQGDKRMPPQSLTRYPSTSLIGLWTMHYFAIQLRQGFVVWRAS